MIDLDNSVKVVDLIPDGQNIKVVEANKKEFIKKYAQAKLTIEI